MSKTFDASWMREEVEACWRRFAESVTGFPNRYRYDPFFRTEINVIALLALFSIVVLGLTGASFAFLYRDIAHAIQDGIGAGIASGDVGTIAPAIVGKITDIRTRNLLIIDTIIVATTVVLGYVIARVTLTPARDALSAQKQFIGNIAHEVRTPLAVIKTNTEVALLDEVSADMRETLLSNVEELDRISEIINNLLSLSSLVKPEHIEFTAVDVAAIAADTVQKYSALAKIGEHQVTLRKGADTIVLGNSTAIQQIVGNLLKNALNYTPKGGHIRISVEHTDNRAVELTVQDSGVGIAKGDLYRIFEPFYRADPSRTKGAGGSGLGLAIVSELVKLHQAKITIRSAIGRGTTVCVVFPAFKAPIAVGHQADATEDMSEIAVDFSRR